MGNAFLELVVREVSDQFREDETASVHPLLSEPEGEGWECRRDQFVILKFKSFSVQIPAILLKQGWLQDLTKYFTGH